MGGNLKSVAQAAGVSLATASRVLSGSTYSVSAELRERVLAVAQELDYVPNAQARALITGNTKTVGMLVGDVGDPYFHAMIHGVHEVAAEESCLVTVMSTDRDPEVELEAFRQLQSHGTSIVIVAGSGLDDPDYRTGLSARIRSLSSAGRTVLMGRHDLDPDVVAIQVGADNVDAGRVLGRHLAELGHRRVGVLSGSSTVTSTTDRIEGLAEGLGVRPEVVEVVQTRDGGYAGTDTLLRRSPDLTAVVGTADQMAIGALSYCADHDIAVPGDISIAGCNDIWVGRDLTPGLTTVHMPLREMGAAALRLALGSELGTRQSFPVQLVVRASTGPVAEEVPPGQ